MNFAKFILSEPDDEMIFSPRRLYVVDGYVRGVEVNDNIPILVNGKRLLVSLDDKRFKFYEKANVVWLGGEPVISKNIGDVLIAKGVDGECFDIENVGFINKKHFELVDCDVLNIGTWIMNKQTSKWGKATVFDDKNFVGTSLKLSKRLPLIDFVFPVYNGEILKEPIVVCTDDFMQENLEKDKMYFLEEGLPEKDGMVKVRDGKLLLPAMASRFSWKNK